MLMMMSDFEWIFCLLVWLIGFNNSTHYEWDSNQPGEL